MAQSSPGPAARPLSPHVQVWRWHITMFCSIATRATGIALYVGFLILAGWAMALAAGPDAYLAYTGLLGSWPGKLVLFGLAVSVLYHLAAGVRHLFWDAGKGFELKTADATAWGALAFGFVGAVVVFVIAHTAGAL
jgi:succinate dehydrogenase / fumarate reductase cytochrome b subunit